MSNLRGASDPGRLPSLDGIRGLSILLVLVAHQATAFARSSVSIELWYLQSFGSLGVNMFFGLSGFLITSLLVGEHDTTGHIDLPRFYLRRSFRILPPFLVFLLASALVAQHVLSRDFWLAGLFIADYAHPKSWWLGHTWSLGVEEQFYLLWPATLAVLGRRGGANLALALILAQPLIRVGSYVVAPELRPQLDFMLHNRLDSLMTGCLLAMRWNDPRSRVVAFLSSPWTAAVGAAYLFGLSPVLAHVVRGYKYVFGYGLDSIAIAGIIGWSVRNAAHPAAALLNTRWLSHVGHVSYSLYLWQQPLFDPALAGRSWTEFPLNLVLAFGAAELSHRIIERPFLRLRGWLQSIRPAVT